jgi:hypothetical protein
MSTVGESRQEAQVAPHSDKKNPLSVLRYAVFLCVHLETFHVISVLPEAVANIVLHQTAGGATHGREQPYVLQNGHLWPQYIYKTKIVLEQLVAWVIYVSLSSKAEALAWRPTNDHIYAAKSLRKSQ